MVAASDGSLWVADTGRGRVVRIDTGAAQVVYRAGRAIGELAGGDVAAGDRRRRRPG